jgi:hypothetical protein
VLRIIGQRSAVIGFLVLAVCGRASALAWADATASRSLTIQSSGPRTGEAGSKYFNVEGKNKERYASFGVLVFQLPRGEPAAQSIVLTLTLVQSIAAFASDGKVKFYLAEPVKTDQESLEQLKFDANVANGLGKDFFKALHELGGGTFKKLETGRVDRFKLTLDEAGGRYLRDVARMGGAVHLVVAPDDADVAATYFGAGDETEANRPKLSFGSERAD